MNVWAVAVTLYEMIHGKRPFNPEDPNEQWNVDVNPGLPPVIRQLFLNAFEKDLNARTTTADGLKAAINMTLPLLKNRAFRLSP